MKTIGILKEPSFETRVSLLPKEIGRITSEMKLHVVFEAGIGSHLDIADEEYISAGAKVLPPEDIFQKADFIPSINSVYHGQEFSHQCEFLGIYNFGYFPSRISEYLRPNISVSSLDLLPRTTQAQKMDILSSMASLNGYKAVIKAADQLSMSIPMFTTAAGTLRPLKVLVLGAGVAGLQAIATAKRLGAIVEVFDVRSTAGEAVRSLGAKFIEVPGYRESESAGGYAIQQTEEYLQKQKELIDQSLRTSSIVICTANIPGMQAPVLIDKEGAGRMSPGSIIVDLAAEQGGNCELTQNGEIIKSGNIKIIGDSHLSRELPKSASTLLSTNYYNFIHHKISTGDMEDDLLKSCSVIQNGVLLNPKIKVKINTI